jgi:hypothetical protein
MKANLSLTRYHKKDGETVSYLLTVETGDDKNGGVGHVPGLTWAQAMPLVYSGVPVEDIEVEEEAATAA